MFRFTIRDMLWLMLVVNVCVALTWPLGTSTEDPTIAEMIIPVAAGAILGGGAWWLVRMSGRPT